ncbi:FtsK/SpoIIIE domain-containing protein, partial [Streptococcus suis]
VLDLARHYSPSELHIYLMDFGTSGLVPMGDLPHVADVFLLDQEDKIGKFIRLLEKEINRRKKLLTEHRVGTLSMYRQLTGQVEPRIVIALDSFESMKDESFEAELLKLLTRISREGQAIGLHLVVTASRQANLRATFYSNFKHQLTLKQHDKTEVRSVVGATGLAEIEDIKGRALYKGEEVYSLQLVLPLRVEHDIELVDRMREEVSRQKAAWTGQVPEAIPMVPEELTREDFLSRASVQKAIASGQIPLGLDLETVEAVSWERKNGNLVYLSDKSSQMVQFTEQLAEISHLSDRYLLVFAPEFNSLPEDFGDNILTQTEGVMEMLRALSTKIDERIIERKEEFVALIVFHDYTNFIASLPDEAIALIAHILEKGSRVGYASVVLTDTSISKKIDAASKVVKTMKEGLLAVRIADQNLFTVTNKPLREGPLALQTHYVVSNQQMKLVKVLVGE